MTIADPPSGFQRDLLCAIALADPHPKDDAGRPHGQAVMRALNGWDVPDSRVYNNLQRLEARGLIRRTAIDDKTDAVELTDSGRDELRAWRDRIEDALEASEK